MQRRRGGLLALLTLGLAAGCVGPRPPAPDPTGRAYRFPVGGEAWYHSSASHAGYPAADVFADCGTPLVAPATGVVTGARTVDLWRADTDNPAHRGGRFVAIVGDDGVRYYLAHLSTVEVRSGQRVLAGDRVGAVGISGRAGACHLHLGLSPPCAAPEWAVRRGAVWPWPYLDAWRAGEPRSPRDEVAAWQRTWPSACALAALLPHAAEA